jgi:hypothetical protein
VVLVLDLVRSHYVCVCVCVCVVCVNFHYFGHCTLFCKQQNVLFQLSPFLDMVRVCVCVCVVYVRRQQTSGWSVSA